MIRIGTSINSSGMGDILLLTSICKHIPNLTVELHPKAKKYAIFFENICKEVIITSDPVVTPDVPPGHFALQKLRSFGLDNVCYLPYLYPKPEYLSKGLDLISQYKNPIVFISNCAQHSHNREPDVVYMQKLIDNLAQEYTVLQFGLSSNITKFSNTIPILDLSIYDLICYYSAIKKLVGVDTGDAHLMLALGGYCELHIPYNQYARNSEWWNYKNYHQVSYYYF